FLRRESPCSTATFAFFGVTETWAEKVVLGCRSYFLNLAPKIRKLLLFSDSRSKSRKVAPETINMAKGRYYE
ncbi:hypothetical protein, partial [Pontibacillus yanchengensis]|uniref:hypothetical protein n=1 Tax=Pontibacillus yanchengensis TaxID=462910 RepID=UPI00056369C5